MYYHCKEHDFTCHWKFWRFKKSMALHRKCVRVRKKVKGMKGWRLVATLVHECDGHVWQQIRDGWWTFYWRYLWDTKVREGQGTAADSVLVWKREGDRIGWRAVYEAEAYGLSAKVWVKNHRLLSVVLDNAAWKIRNRKYPRFWFGKRPTLDVALWLVKSYYNGVWEVR